MKAINCSLISFILCYMAFNGFGGEINIKIYILALIWLFISIITMMFEK